MRPRIEPKPPILPMSPWPNSIPNRPAPRKPANMPPRNPPPMKPGRLKKLPDGDADGRAAPGWPGWVIVRSSGRAVGDVAGVGVGQGQCQRRCDRAEREQRTQAKAGHAFLPGKPIVGLLYR